MFKLFAMLMPKLWMQFADEGGAIAPAQTPEPSGAEALESAMKDALSDGTVADAPENETPEETPEAVKPLEPAKEEVPEDPEFDIELEGKAQKVKLSQLKKGFMQESDYTKKSQELAKQREEVNPLLEFVNIARKDPKATEALVTFVEKFMNEDKINQEFIGKFLEFAGGKAEEPKIDLTQDQELAAALSEIDPDSGVGKALTKILSRNQLLEKKLGEIETGIKTKEQQQIEAQNKEAFQKQVDTARTFYTERVKTLADPEKGQFKFETKEDQKDWEDLVFRLVKNDDTQVQSNEDFQRIIDQHGKAAYDKINGIRERALAKHLQAQKTPLPVGNAAKGKSAAGAPQKDLSMQESIEQMLKEQLQESGD